MSVIAFLFLCIPLTFAAIFIGLIIRLFFSQYKKIIFLAIFLIIAGFILFCVGMIPIVAAGAAASGAGRSSINYDPGLPFLLSVVSLIAAIPCAIIGFFKK